MTKIFFSNLLVLLLIGCASLSRHYVIAIDSISGNYRPPNNKCILLPADKNLMTSDFRPSDLQFIEYSSHVKRSLVFNCSEIVDFIDNADILIFLDYGVGQPREHVISIPQYGQTGVQSAQTTFLPTFNNNLPLFANTTYTPTYGVVGYNQESSNVFPRFIRLEAYDLDSLRAQGTMNQLWKTNIFSEGSGSDLRQIFPILINAAIPYIGKNIGKKINLQVSA